jgi:ribonuclease VapC
MFVDASALTAILAREVDYIIFLEKLSRASRLVTSLIAVLETSIAIARLLEVSPLQALERVTLFRKEMQIDLIAIPAEAASLAVDAYHRFGKSRHPAALNMGDCFAYACARHARVPLLYKGGDFAQTDIEPA